MTGSAAPGASLVISGPGERRTYTLGPRAVIGRAPDADVTIDNQDISRQHVTITWTGEAYVIEDLGSKNGTLLNGERLAGTRRMADGDEIVLPGVILRFELVDATRTATLTPARAVRLDAARGELIMNGKAVTLTAKELMALEHMASRPGQLVRKDDLAEAVWPENKGITSDEAIEQLIKRLRQKLEEDPAHPKRLVTRRGLGYVLDLDLDRP